MKKRKIYCCDILLKQCIVVFFCLYLIPGYSYSEQDSSPASKESILTLREAVEIALKNNRSLQRSRLSLASSSLNVQLQNEQFDVKIIPATSVNYNSSDNQYWSAGVKFFKESKVGISGSITPKIEEIDDTQRSSVNLMLNVPLLRGLGTAYNLDGLYGSLYALETAKRAHYKQQDGLVINTISTVYGIINIEKQINLLFTQIVGLKKHISLTEIKEKTGLASTMDMYRAELRLKEVQNQLTIVEKQFETNVDRLKNLLGSSMQSDLTVTASIDYRPVTVQLDEAVAIALEKRIEIEQALRKSEESKRKVAVARHEILPIIDLHLGYNRYDESESSFLDEEDWIVSLSGSSDLFRSAAKTAFEQANINFQQSKIDVESSREDVIREVRAQINQMKKKEQLIVDRGEQLRQAQGKLELARSKFNHQLADNFDLLEAQTERQQVETELLFDRIGYIIDTYKLRSVLGTLIER
jgi:outer membrane protein